MGKVEENKHKKLEALFHSAYELFVTKGITKTSIHDIVQKAGIAKGTFYLYFKDKYEIRDKLVEKTAAGLLLNAYNEMRRQEISEFEEKVLFIVNYTTDELIKNKEVLRFISKNLSWGIFRQVITENELNPDVDVMGAFRQLMGEDAHVRLREPETMLFLIMELVSSVAYSVVFENAPVSYEKLKPDLNETVRAIIRSHIEEEKTETI